MFRDYVDFSDALVCYEHLADRKKDSPAELRILLSNFRMYAKLRAETKNDILARDWVIANDDLSIPDDDVGVDDGVYNTPDAIKALAAKPVEDSPKPIETLKPEPAPEDPRSFIDSMIGLSATKKQIDTLMNYMNIMAIRRSKNLPLPELSLHMAFLGNPGTGKTTVARSMAGVLHSLGFSRSNRVIEVDRSDLIGAYIGHTEEKTRALFEKAQGGVLFIDEAHTLLQPHCDLDFGRECTDILCKLMEDYRNDVIVILAGYPVEMKSTILSHKGIKSRIGHYIDFPDYSPKEAVLIFKSMCKANGYSPKTAALEKLAAYFRGVNRDKCGKNANARDVRNIFEKSLMAQAVRLSSLKNPTKKKLQEIFAEDIVIPAHTKSGTVIYLKK